jgi:hypothetical protein
MSKILKKYILYKINIKNMPDITEEEFEKHIMTVYKCSKHLAKQITKELENERKTLL